MRDDVAILKKINALLAPHHCTATDLGPKSVGVQGDARFYGSCVFITTPPDMTLKECGEIATEIINQTHEISRVLMDITPL